MSCYSNLMCFLYFFFFQAEDGIRGAQESRGLGDVYKRQTVPQAVKMEVLLVTVMGLLDYGLKKRTRNLLYRLSLIHI